MHLCIFSFVGTLTCTSSLSLVILWKGRMRNEVKDRPLTRGWFSSPAMASRNAWFPSLDSHVETTQCLDDHITPLQTHSHSLSSLWCFCWSSMDKDHIGSGFFLDIFGAFFIPLWQDRDGRGGATCCQIRTRVSCSKDTTFCTWGAALPLRYHGTPHWLCWGLIDLHLLKYRLSSWFI